MNHYHNTDQDLDAIIERLRRLETRLCKLMIHMGLEPTGEPIPTQPPVQPLDHEPNPSSVQNHTILKKMLGSLKIN
jgi:hypothetical protein